MLRSVPSKPRRWSFDAKAVTDAEAEKEKQHDPQDGLNRRHDSKPCWERFDYVRIGEPLRQWMMSDGLWKDRRHRLPSPHQPRRRRDCLGELVQIDGSEHAWFEDRGAVCTLLAFVDDATSRLMTLRFVVSESAFDYFRTDAR